MLQIDLEFAPELFVISFDLNFEALCTSSLLRCSSRGRSHHGPAYVPVVDSFFDIVAPPYSSLGTSLTILAGWRSNIATSRYSLAGPAFGSAPRSNEGAYALALRELARTSPFRLSSLEASMLSLIL